MRGAKWECLLALGLALLVLAGLSACVPGGLDEMAVERAPKGAHVWVLLPPSVTSAEN